MKQVRSTNDCARVDIVAQDLLAGFDIAVVKSPPSKSRKLTRTSDGATA